MFGCNGRVRRRALPLFFAVLGLVCGGCRSDLYYQNRAVERAREFLLDEAPELTPEQVYFVKFNKPVLLTMQILGAPSEFMPDDRMLKSEQQQICVTWTIPGREDRYMVFGSSSGRMDNWYPLRLLRKRHEKISMVVINAAERARTFMQNALYDQLSAAEYNFIRFTFPWVVTSNFPLVTDPAGKLSEAERLKVERQLAGREQYSLIWKLPDDGGYWVFCGTAGKNFAGWSLNFGGRFSPREAEASITGVVRTPDQAYLPFPEPEAKAVAVPVNSPAPVPETEKPVKLMNPVSEETIPDPAAKK